MTTKITNRVVFAFCAMLVISLGGIAESKANPIIETGIPKGFEDLSKPQFILADLYYGGQKIGTTPITVHPTYITFNSPTAVFDLLPQSTNPTLIAQLLQKPQDKNAHRVCQNLTQIDCGYLVPEDFAVIYDSDLYRLDIFFAPELLPQQQAIASPFLPASSSGASLIQNLSATWSGVDSQTHGSNYSATLNGNTIIGFGEHALRSQWHYLDEQGYQVSNLHWSRDFRGKTYSAGLFQPSGNFGYFTPAKSLFGFEFRNSHRTRTDLSHRQGALIEVNMPVRGRIEVYRENRLIYTDLLDAGNRVLNTSNLPSGAYEIEIRTFDESGRPLGTFIEFFAKDYYLPAPGEWHWGFLAGMPTKVTPYRGLPDYHNEGFLQAYLGRRISDNIALFSSVSASESEQVFELGGRWVSSLLELSPNLMLDGKGRKGYRLEALLETSWFTVSASSVQLDNSDPVYSDENYSILNNGFSQRNFSLQTQLWGGSLALRYSERDRFTLPGASSFDDSRNKLSTLSFQRAILKGDNWLGNLTFSYNRSDHEDYSSIEFQFRHRSNHWQHTASLQSEYGNTPDGDPHRITFDSRWHDRDIWAMEVEQSFGAETHKHGYRLESHSRLSGRQGFIDTAISLSDENNQRVSNYLGSFNTSLMTTGKQFAWGGERALESAIIVDIDGSDNKTFEVLVNGSRHGYAKGGGLSVVNLPAFNSYDVSLRPLDDGFFQYREKSHAITLYPGNIAEASYNIQPLYVIMGRLTSYGNGLPDTLVSINNYQVSTDQYGVFQLEVPIDIQDSTQLEVKWLTCTINLQVEDSGANWINLGTLQQSDDYCLPAFSLSKHDE
ncbi:TcfC E-set like domain-containing protein [Microbulbifer sp. SSSA002]|uniref:TcfC E-set like domain-containing protein n=1 Tax=Microbulbifer sp. SSSA002 TaxID=3243376 RepID=UPI00403A5F9D